MMQSMTLTAPPTFKHTSVLWPDVNSYDEQLGQEVLGKEKGKREIAFGAI